MIQTGTDNALGVALGDVDKDGDLDLVVAGDNNRLYLNDGHGLFTLNAANLGTGAAAVAVGDVNGDQYADIVLGYDGGQNTLYLAQVTSGTWSGMTASSGAFTGDATTHTTAVVLADINADNKLDVIFGNKGETNHLYLNGASGLATTKTDIGSETDDTTAIAVGDVDGDGAVLDVVAGNSGDPSRVYLRDTSGAGIAWKAAQQVGTATTECRHLTGALRRRQRR